MKTYQKEEAEIRNGLDHKIVNIQYNSSEELPFYIHIRSSLSTKQAKELADIILDMISRVDKGGEE